MEGKGEYGQAPPAYSTNPPPPPYGGHPQQHVVVAAPAMQFGELPIPMTCPFCHAQVVTGTAYKPGMLTWIAVGTICLVGAAFMGITWFGCCLIPCCVSACKDVEHSCPNCNRPVGTYDRLKNL